MFATGIGRFLSAIKVRPLQTFLDVWPYSSYVGYPVSTSDFIPVSGVPCIIPRHSQIPWDASFVCPSEITLWYPLMIVDIHVRIVSKDTFSVSEPPPIQFQESILLFQCNVVDSYLERVSYGNQRANHRLVGVCSLWISYFYLLIK